MRARPVHFQPWQRIAGGWSGWWASVHWLGDWLEWILWAWCRGRCRWVDRRGNREGWFLVGHLRRSNLLWTRLQGNSSSQTQSTHRFADPYSESNLISTDTSSQHYRYQDCWDLSNSTRINRNGTRRRAAHASQRCRIETAEAWFSLP